MVSKTLKLFSVIVCLAYATNLAAAELRGTMLPNGKVLVCSESSPGFENKKGRFVLLRKKIGALRRKQKKLRFRGQNRFRITSSIQKWRKILRDSKATCLENEVDVPPSPSPTPTPSPQPIGEAFIELSQRLPKVEPTPRTVPACQDGVDNDGDGFIDYPNDPGCFSRNDNFETAEGVPVSECLTIEICSNGIDDNCSGAVDEIGCLVRNARITRNNSSTIDHATLIDDSYAAGELIEEVNFLDDPGIGMDLAGTSVRKLCSQFYELGKYRSHL
jgi:hypothetical protein